MIRLPRLFGSRASRPAAAALRPALDALIAEVSQLERTLARNPDPVTRAREWNRVAITADGMGEGARAKQYFGRAIDAYIEAGFYETAVALCRRFLVRYPDVVRAHCTLALLCVVRRDLGDAIEEIQTYARAARRTNTDHLAVSRLRLVASCAVDEDVRKAAVQAIGELGDSDAQKDILLALSGAIPLAMDAENLHDLVAVALLNEMEVTARIQRSGNDPSESDEILSPTTIRTRFPQPMDFADSDSHWLG